MLDTDTDSAGDNDSNGSDADITGDDGGTEIASDDAIAGDVDQRVLEATTPSADREEAAAIAAAIASHLRDEERAAAAEGKSDRGWAEAGWRWAFAGRMRGLGERTVRVPDDAPTDSWTAAGRVDRMR